MPYWRLHYHLVWSTAGRHPLITPLREPIIYETIYAKARELGATLHAVDGTEDHLHLVTSIPPTRSIADCVKHWKGTTARAVNRRETTGHVFQWQAGYGALTMGGRSLANVITYVTHQKRHHAEGTLVQVYEQFAEQSAFNSRLQTT